MTVHLASILDDDFDFDLISEEEAAEYIDQLQAALGDQWLLTPKQLYAEAVWEKCDWLLYGGAAGGAKDLALRELVATPSGWSTVADLRVGDELFTERGGICKVIQLHPTALRPVYRMTFDDGSEVLSGPEHRWWTFDATELAQLTRLDPEWRARRQAKRPSRAGANRTAAQSSAIAARNRRVRPDTKPAPVGGIRTTAEIAATLRTASGRNNHAVPVCGQVDLPERDLPVDPYVLGAWLGDGSRASNTIASHEDDQPHMRAQFEAAGHPTTDRVQPATFGALGLCSALRRAGVYKDKHVPAAYLRASAKQRLALLQGLMDTDGTVNDSGSVTFVNTNRGLVEAVVEIACSLGHKVRMTEKRATLNGEDRGPVWSAKWTAPDPVFRLPRKLAKQNMAGRRTTRMRYIVACEYAGVEATRCITVSNPTGIFLAGRQFIPTHNSELAIHHANRLSQEIPGHHSLLLRRSIPELRRSLIIRLIARIQRYKIKAKYRKLDGQSGFQYANGSLIECGHCQTDEAVAKYLSAEYDLMVIDEATTLTADQITQVASRLRTTREKAAAGARPHLGLFTNPGGLSHAWMYDLFITPTAYGQKIVVFDISQGFERKFIVAEYEAPTIVNDADKGVIVDTLLPWVRSLDIPRDPSKHLVVGFVPSKATDNPYLDPSYLRALNTLDERRRRQLRDGDWDTFEGMHFPEFRREIHVIQPFEVPESWPRVRGIDFGSTAPYCCLWVAWDNDGNAYVYREDYDANLTPQEQARRVIEKSMIEDDRGRRKEKFERTVADPSVFSNHRGVGQTIADMWRDGGLHVTKAKNQRIAGWTNIRQYLWDYARAEVDPKLAPRLFIFDTCTNLTRTFPIAQSDEDNPEDMATKWDDHALDALRYALAVRPVSATQRTERRAANADERFNAMLRKLDKRRRPRW